MTDSKTKETTLSAADQSKLGKPPGLAEKSFDQTQTIDINTLVLERLTVSGSFDLRQEKIDAFGKLLQALSIPTVLIARSHKVEFANKAFMNTFAGSEPSIGVHLSSLFSDPGNRRRVDLLIEDVFARRQPAVSEAKLRIHESGVWVRIHLRTIRLLEDRLALAQIENLSAEKELQAVQKVQESGRHCSVRGG